MMSRARSNSSPHRLGCGAFITSRCKSEIVACQFGETLRYCGYHPCIEPHGFDEGILQDGGDIGEERESGTIVFCNAIEVCDFVCQLLSRKRRSVGGVDGREHCGSDGHS